MFPAVVRRWAAPIAVLSGLLLSGLLVMHTSQAAFNASTSNTGSSLASGHVVLTDNLNGVSMFSLSGLGPGSTGTRCIDVTYRGSLDAVVRLTADYDTSDTTSALAPYLDFTIDQIGATATCNATAGAVRNPFLATDTTLKAKVDRLRSSSADLGWAPTGNSNETRRYRFSYTLQNDNAAQAKTASVGFVWHAKNLIDGVTAPGTFQTQLGCTQNWQPDCAVPSLTDTDGDDLYTWQTTAITAGTWQTKIAIGGTWGINYGAGGVKDGTNISFTVPANGATTKFSYDSNTHVLTVTSA
ncbi:hypothetical protein [Kineosporia sp. NBRC 101731]|uniref:pullulanase X25 domain-containing protein n=1 Tax=Kineosporia sp. NBRC 101731 TaxID=3032199 RepID=UPI0024A3EE3C|nr:hypothetical protein [Kineosporia sp. NBRC 101731]GLY32254.1 hypothetical protein Kisp02_56190 [Kineosporia sp. NBRC 101731]